MRRRPRMLMALAIVFLMLAISMPIQAMWIYGHTFQELSAVFAKLTWINWLICIGLVISAGLLWEASPYSKRALAGLSALVILNNFVVGYYSTDFSLATTSFASFGFLLLNVPLFHPDLSFIFQHPEQRWWLRAERKRVSVPVFIEGTRLNSLRAETFDLSESGVFVASMRNVGVGDWITVRMTFGAFAQIRCQGRVVRRTEANGIYPDGVGIQFVDMSFRQRRDLRKFLSRRNDNVEPPHSPTTY